MLPSTLIVSLKTPNQEFSFCKLRQAITISSVNVLASLRSFKLFIIILVVASHRPMKVYGYQVPCRPTRRNNQARQSFRRSKGYFSFGDTRRNHHRRTKKNTNFFEASCSLLGAKTQGVEPKGDYRLGERLFISCSIRSSSYDGTDYRSEHGRTTRFG